MFLSIIIPVYNGADTIGRCLDSIYKQGLSENDFEVICVDDNSPNPTSVAEINNYQYRNKRPSNLILIQHKINKRQGGARNTGIRAAKGEWILFIDQDDFYTEKSIVDVVSAAKCNLQLDFIMFDCVSGDGNETKNIGSFFNLNQSIMSGTVFLQCQPVPWCPWCYLYKRSFLLASRCFFAENVRFEDADFVLNITAKARLTRFLPIILVYHTEHLDQTSQMGKDKNRIGDFLKMNYRIANLAQDYSVENSEASLAILKHAVFMRRSALLRYLWRLSYNEIKALLYDCKYPLKTGDNFVDFSNGHIKMTAFALTLLKPFFFFYWKIKQLTKLLFHEHSNRS